MRNIVTALILIVIHSGAGHTQSWERLIPDWEAVRVENMLAPGDGNIYATGFNSTLLQSDDDGKTWRDAGLPLEYINLHSIASDEKYLYITGESFDYRLFPVTQRTDSLLRLFRYDIYDQSLVDISIKRTKPDNYPNHPLISPPIVSCAGNMVFVTEQRPGNYPCVLRKSSDQGMTWKELEAPGGMRTFEALSDDVLISVTILNDTVRIHRSGNAGESWEVRYTAPIFTALYAFPVTAARGSDSIVAIGLGYQVVLSEDAGISWRKVSELPWNSSHPEIHGIDLDSLGTIIVVGYESDTYKSTDNGVNWLRIMEASGPVATSVLANERGAINISNKAGHFYHSEDFGLTWETVRMNDIRGISELHFYDAKHGFLIAGDWYTSSNGGQSWRRCKSLPANFRGIASISSGSILYGYGQTDIGDSTIVTIYNSTNLGDTWNTVAANTFPVPNGIGLIYDASGIFLCTPYTPQKEPQLWFSIDSGRSWDYHTLTDITDTGGSLNFVHKIDSAGSVTLYCYSQTSMNADIFYSRDSGRSWLDAGFFPDPLYTGIRSFQAFPPDELYCHLYRKGTGGFGTSSIQQYISDDGGRTWQLIRDITGRPDYSFSVFRGDAFYWYYLSRFKILKAVAPWTNEEVFLWKDPYGGSEIFFLDDDNAWVAGGQTIYRTTNGGTSWTEMPFTVQDDAAITAIYPNPVSAGQSAAVEIHLPIVGAQHAAPTGDRRSPLRIAIYNFFGREVAVLYNGPADPGTRTLTWRPAPTLPAGMYVVRMSHGEKVWAKQVAVLR